MIPSQLEHLKLLDSHLTNLLENAAKRTPGEWQAWENIMNDEYYSSRIRASTHRNMASVISKHEDATFIASCAGNAEAGWKSTQAAVSLILSMLKRQHDIETAKTAFDAIESIIAAWPLELLKK